MIHGRLGELIAEMPQDELRVMLRIAERLAMGRKQYGQLDIANTPKNWKLEASEEFLDAAVYSAIWSLKEKP